MSFNCFCCRTYWRMVDAEGIEEVSRKKGIVFLWSSISIVHKAPCEILYKIFCDIFSSLYLSIWHTSLPQSHSFPCLSTPLLWNSHVAPGNVYGNTRKSYLQVSASMRIWPGSSQAPKYTLHWSCCSALTMCVVQVYQWKFWDYICTFA